MNIMDHLSKWGVSNNMYTIMDFYNLLQATLSCLGITNLPANIWNMDERAFFIDPVGGKVVSEIGDKTKRVVSGCGRTCFTGVACISAAGVALDPLIIFDGLSMQSSWKGNPPLKGTTFTYSSKFSLKFLKVRYSKPCLVPLCSHIQKMDG
jgi:hypothetical protein